MTRSVAAGTARAAQDWLAALDDGQRAYAAWPWPDGRAPNPRVWRPSI